MNRRHFILGGGLAIAAGTAGWRLLERPQANGVLFSAFEDLSGRQYVGGLDAATGRVFGRSIPVRAHGNAHHASRPGAVLFFARRPGVHAYRLDLSAMQVSQAFTTGRGRHLAGHGLYASDGSVLYTPEYDYETPRGMITVREPERFELITEFATQGLDPHEIAWLPDGKTLVVANGGILTHPRSFRRKLNIPTMDPSLCLIDAATGRCLEQMRLDDHLLSIRHLAVTSTGTVVAGLQYEAEARFAPSVAAVYRPGTGFRLLDLPEQARYQVNGYVASIAASDVAGEVAAACPLGNGIARWALESGEFLGFETTQEVYGLSYAPTGDLLASQRDGSAIELTQPDVHELTIRSPRRMRWDDHWTLAPDTVRAVLPQELDVV